MTPEDHLAHLAGTQQTGLAQSIEDVIFRAQAADEQERRSIAQQPATAPGGAGTDAAVPAFNAGPAASIQRVKEFRAKGGLKK